MDEIIREVRNKSKIKILYGVFLILLGLLVHLIPFVPASWIIVIGLEVLGVRLLVKDLIISKAKTSKFFAKFIHKE